MLTLVEACRGTGHELLLEVIANKAEAPVDATTIPRAMARFYDLGVYPDWWKLPSPAGARPNGTRSPRSIERRDPHCRGVLLLGLDAPAAELEAAFALAAAAAGLQGLRRRPHDLRRAGAGPGSRASSTTRRRWRRWPRPTAA